MNWIRRAAVSVQASLLPGLALAGLLLSVYTFYKDINNPAISDVTRAQLLAGCAIIFLLLGLAGMAYVFPRFHLLKQWPGSLSGSLVLSFLLPFLLILMPEWLLPGLKSWLIPGRSFPYVYILQASLLAAILVLWKAGPRRRLFLPINQLPLTLLASIGLWLAAAFLFSSLSTNANISDRPWDAWRNISLLPFGLCVLVLAPWAQETFFRGLLLDRYTTWLGPVGGILITSAIFATLQMRLIAWLPAFLVSIGLSIAARHDRTLSTSIVMHILFNLLSFLLNPTWVL